MATALMPSSLHAQITRRAISPRFAIRIFLNMNSSCRTSELPACYVPRRPGNFKLNGSVEELDFRPASKPPLTVWGFSPGKRGAALALPYSKQRHPICHRTAISNVLLPDHALRVGLNFVHQLHGLDDAQHLPVFP